MRLIVVGALLLAGCGGPAPEIAECEADAQRDLRSPSTYKLIEAKRFTNPPEQGEINAARERFGLEGIKDAAIGVMDIFIEYDAANVYGTPIRSMEHCQWLTLNGKTNRRIDPVLEYVQTEEDIANTRRLIEAGDEAGESGVAVVID